MNPWVLGYFFFRMARGCANTAAFRLIVQREVKNAKCKSKSMRIYGVFGAGALNSCSSVGRRGVAISLLKSSCVKLKHYTVNERH